MLTEMEKLIRIIWVLRSQVSMSCAGKLAPKISSGNPKMIRNLRMEVIPVYFQIKKTGPLALNVLGMFS